MRPSIVEQKGNLIVSKDALSQAGSTTSVKVTASETDSSLRVRDIAIEPLPIPCVKKNIFVPRCIISFADEKDQL